SFYENYAAQCGFCTSGFVLASEALLQRSPRPTREQIIEALAGHVCRCTGYVKIVSAVEAAARGEVAEEPAGPEPGSETAAEVLELVDVELEERPAFFDIRKAYDPDAPKVHPWGPVFPHYGPHNHRRIRKGDVDWAFDQADVIVEGVYRPQAIEHCPLEPQTALAVPQPDGRLTIHTCTQAMYFSMGVVAAHLQWPLNKLKFVGGTVGGGFGGKVDTATETISALLALKAHRPVKWRWTREEEFLESSTRAAWHMGIADAVTQDGWLLGRKMTTLHDAGAYTRVSSYGVT